eukprot:scaffold115171_cov24-Cyclotella_meneghiniana.AAC.1
MARWPRPCLGRYSGISTSGTREIGCRVSPRGTDSPLTKVTRYPSSVPKNSANSLVRSTLALTESSQQLQTFLSLPIHLVLHDGDASVYVIKQMRASNETRLLWQKSRQYSTFMQLCQSQCIQVPHEI